MILINNPAYGQQLAALIKSRYYPESCTNICRVNNGTLLGGCIYNDFQKEASVSIHVASTTPRWMNRVFLFVAFDYPFNQLGVPRVYAPVPGDNFHTIDFVYHLGFSYTTSIPAFYRGGVPRLYYHMDRENCRFLKINPRSIKPKAA